jgi:hypothetical protein
MSEIIDTRVITDKEYICSKEKFLELKSIQKNIALQLHSEHNYWRSYYSERRKYYHSQGLKVDTIIGSSITADILLKFKPLNILGIIPNDLPRYFNIMYSLIKGTKYQKIESKVREGNELNKSTLEWYCNHYDIDYTKIEALIW